MFDAAAELEDVRASRKARRRRTTRRSRLDRYTAELHALRTVGGSLADCVFFLRQKKIKAGRSTVHRFLAKAKKNA